MLDRVESLKIYRNNLKNREFDKETSQNSDLERVTIAESQGASEDQNFERKPTPSKTDSSSCFGIIQTVPETGQFASNSPNPSFAKSSIASKNAPKEGLFKRLVHWILSVLCCCKKKPQALLQKEPNPPSTSPIKRDFKIVSIDDLYFAFMKATVNGGDPSYLVPMLEFIKSNSIDHPEIKTAEKVINGIATRYDMPEWRPLFDAFIGRTQKKELLDSALHMTVTALTIMKTPCFIEEAEKLITAGADSELLVGDESAAAKIRWWKEFFQK